MIKFSIAIPAYKRRYIEEAVRSVVMQTYQNWELIIVDDCSHEDLHSAILPFLADYRIKYFRNSKNCGAVNVVDNWNICLSKCTGDYVICMGDDDRLLPGCLAEYDRLINNYPGRYVYHGRTEVIDSKGNKSLLLEEREETETGYEMMFRQWTDDRRQFIGDFLFERNWLEEHGGYVKFPLAYSSDWATASLAAANNGIANTNVAVFEYRDNDSSISRSQNLRVAANAAATARDWFCAMLNAQQDIRYKKLESLVKKYYNKKIADMAYLEIRDKPSVATLHYWLTLKRKKSAHKCGTGTIRMFIVCLRALLSFVKKKK